MLKITRLPFAALLLSAPLALGACGPKAAADGTASDSGTDSDTDATTSTTTDASSTTDASTTTGGSTGGSTGAGFINTDTSASAGTTSTGPQPNGSQCETDDQCESMKCYVIPFQGGVCSDCTSDADCMMDGMPGTCGFSQAGYAQCTDGGQGAMCESDAGCQEGMKCAELIDTMGFFPANFCSECAEDADCMNGQLCSPVYDTMNFSGYKECVEPGSVQNNEGCDHTGSGDQACMSGYCDPADVMGFVQIGACGECDPSNNDGCMMGQTCSDPMVDQNTGLQGASCG